MLTALPSSGGTCQCFYVNKILTHAGKSRKGRIC